MTVRPTSRATTSSGPARCRRVARGCSTCAAATVRPTTHRSSPRRTTSTSGSSGTATTVGLGSAAYPEAMEYEESRGMPADAEIVFDVLSDVDTMDRWLPTAMEVESAAHEGGAAAEQIRQGMREALARLEEEVTRRVTDAS